MIEWLHTAWEFTGEATWHGLGYLARWIPWSLPILVALLLYGLHRLLANTKKRIGQIQEKKKDKRQHSSRNLTTAREYKAHFRGLAEQELMSEIRKAARLESQEAESIDLIPLIRSIRLFQSVDQSILTEIAKNASLRTFKQGEVVFGRDPKTGKYVNDLSFLVVVRGEVEISVDLYEKQMSRGSSQKPERVRELLGVVGEGQTVSSILSILESLIHPLQQETEAPATPQQRRNRAQRVWDDELNQNLFQLENDSTDTSPAPSPRTPVVEEEESFTDDEDLVTAVALTETLVAEIPLGMFRELQEQFPVPIIRLSRNICTRLQRVTLLTMNKYFGLTSQLLQRNQHVNQFRTRRPFRPRDSTTFSSQRKQLSYDFEVAFKGFSRLLGLTAEGAEYLRENLQIERHAVGSIVMAPPDTYARVGIEPAQGKNEACEPCVYFIIRGMLDVYLHDEDHINTRDDNRLEVINDEDHLLYQAIQGDMVGQLAVVTGDFYYRVVASSVNGRKSISGSGESSSETVVLGKIRKVTFDQLAVKNPAVINRMVNMIFLQIAPVVKLIDYAVEWEQRQAGELICKQGASAKGMHVVLSGRVRAMRSVSQEEKSRMDFLGTGDEKLFTMGDGNSQGKTIAEYGRGDSFGAMEVLTETPFASSLLAVRDTELALISNRLFKIFIRKFPEVVVRFSQIIGESWKKQMLLHDNPDQSSLSTVAVLGVSSETPVSTFCVRLASELQTILPTIHLDKRDALRGVGKDSFTDISEAHLTRWLGEMEEIYRMVVFECDSTLSPWTKRCLRQADCILIVADSNECPEISELEKYLLRNFTIAARKELVLIHPNSFYPKNTMDWLDLRRGWIHACHQVVDLQVERHAELGGSSRMRSARSHNRNRTLNSTLGAIKRGADTIWKRFKPPRTSSGVPLFGHANPKDDVARIARLLTGKAVGLVLGGGGARGCAHVGVIQALEEAGIPIDMVGGTSIGALMGALYAREPDYINVLTKAKIVAKRMSDRWAQIMDLTWPRVSFFTGSALNDVLKHSLGRTQLEDLRINYFTISTNITSSAMVVHREGRLWRYVRASMSLVGFVPPLCDNGSLLVDGGYTNNLPADVMRSLGVNTVIAVDVGGEVDTDYYNYGDNLSGWWLLWNKWNPFVKREKIPNLSDIQAQLAYVASETTLVSVKQQKHCLYLRPAITQYGTLDFGKFDEICQAGYQCAQEEIAKWKARAVQRSVKNHEDEDIHGDSHHAPLFQPRLRRRSSAGASLQTKYAE